MSMDGKGGVKNLLILKNATDAICEPFVRPPGKGYSGVGFRVCGPPGEENVAKTPQNVHPNHTFDEIITRNHSILSEILAMDCDSITFNFIPQILTGKKGRSLDARKCFLFLRIREFLKFLIFLT